MLDEMTRGILVQVITSNILLNPIKIPPILILKNANSEKKRFYTEGSLF
jgi:hypothetical protein